MGGVEECKLGSNRLECAGEERARGCQLHPWSYSWVCPIGLRPLSHSGLPLLPPPQQQHRAGIQSPRPSTAPGAYTHTLPVVRTTGGPPASYSHSLFSQEHAHLNTVPCVRLRALRFLLLAH